MKLIKRITILTAVGAVLTLSSCAPVDSMADEQYQKEIYLIGAYNRVASFDLPYGDAQQAYVSVAVSGSLYIERNVDVTMCENSAIIDWYNGKYMLDAPVRYQLLDPRSINIPSWRTTIKAGEVYARLPFTVNSQGLHCDSLYAIGVSIASVSDYSKAPEDTSLILTFKLTNAWSGNYQMEAQRTELSEDPPGSGNWIETGMPVPVVIRRTLTAMSADTLRFFHEKTRETLAEYANSYNPGADYFGAINNWCIKMGRTEGTASFTLTAYNSFDILNGIANFDAGKITFSYDYRSGSVRYRMKGSFLR